MTAVDWRRVGHCIAGYNMAVVEWTAAGGRRLAGRRSWAVFVAWILAAIRYFLQSPLLSSLSVFSLIVIVIVIVIVIAKILQAQLVFFCGLLLGPAHAVEWAFPCCLFCNSGPCSHGGSCKTEVYHSPSTWWYRVWFSWKLVKGKTYNKLVLVKISLHVAMLWIEYKVALQQGTFKCSILL